MVNFSAEILVQKKKKKQNDCVARDKYMGAKSMLGLLVQVSHVHFLQKNHLKKHVLLWCSPTRVLSFSFGGNDYDWP